MNLDDLVFDAGDLHVLQQVGSRLSAAVNKLWSPPALPSVGLAYSQTEWNLRYLPDHFLKPPSAMHLWLNSQCDRARTERGLKINVLGPRGGAKSTIGSLAFPLRSAVEGSEPLIWIISDTADQADEHLENIKRELVENELLRRDYPQACGQGHLWRVGQIRLRNGVAIRAFGTGQKIRGRRHGANRPALIICDDIQSDDVMTSALQRDKDLSWLNGTVLKAGNSRTNYLHLATALHREAVAMTLLRTPSWESRVFSSILHWPDDLGLWE
jgi:hypothetical protein